MKLIDGAIAAFKLTGGATNIRGARPTPSLHPSTVHHLRSDHQPWGVLYTTVVTSKTVVGGVFKCALPVSSAWAANGGNKNTKKNVQRGYRTTRP